MDWGFWKICLLIVTAFILLPITLSVFRSSPIGEPVAQDARGNGYNRDR